MSSISNFNNPNSLKELWAKPADISSEPISNFPLLYYEFFLLEIKRLNIEIITYADLFYCSDDWDYKSCYAQEYENWKKYKCDPEKTYLLIQHDVDNHPFFSKRMVAMEQFYGIRSNIFMFQDRYFEKKDKLGYPIDHDFFVEAEKHGFVIGYHQNAFVLSGFDMSKAVERYRSDVNYLRTIYNIRFVCPHGGKNCIIDGGKVKNSNVPMPKEFQGNLRWVYNLYAARFFQRWSDGGLRKVSDVDRIKRFDLVKHFLHNLKKGTRNFCLVHPQRWGYNVDMNQNPILAQEKWYRDICSCNYKSSMFDFFLKECRMFLYKSRSGLIRIMRK